MIDRSPIAILAKAECLAWKLEDDGIVRYFKDGSWGRRFRVSNTDWKISSICLPPTIKATFFQIFLNLSSKPGIETETFRTHSSDHDHSTEWSHVYKGFF